MNFCIQHTSLKDEHYCAYYINIILKPENNLANEYSLPNILKLTGEALLQMSSLYKISKRCNCIRSDIFCVIFKHRVWVIREISKFKDCDQFEGRCKSGAIFDTRLPQLSSYPFICLVYLLLCLQLPAYGHLFNDWHLYPHILKCCIAIAHFNALRVYS